MYKRQGYYIKRVKDVMDGNWKSGAVWQGLKEGMVQIAPYNLSLIHIYPPLSFRGFAQRRTRNPRLGEAACTAPVSYTHLDVYKRQGLRGGCGGGR